MNQFKKYIVLWITQSVSQLGSAMTGFALTLWTYTQIHSAMAVSLMTFCNYVPFILVSLFAGAFVDKHSKKAIMLISDSIAAVCTVAVLLLSASGQLQIWHIYVINAVIGFMNAFQQPASSVAIGKIVPKEKLSNVSGMNSFSSNLVTVFNPILAAFFFSTVGLNCILLIDIVSFLGAFFVLLFVIHIPEEYKETEKQSAFSGTREGFQFLRQQKGLLMIMLTMAFINFFSRLTYENILSPMILARSGDNSVVLGVVNAAMGIGGIVGGMIVSVKKPSKRNARMMYMAAALSFLMGDMMMAVGRNGIAWAVAGIAASLPIPFIMAGNNVIMYSKVPEEMQGRVFSVRNAIQFSTIPFGILLGGFLADYVFEPFMQSGGSLADKFRFLVGTGSGSGMALMFLCTGTIGFIVSCAAYSNKRIRELDNE